MTDTIEKGGCACGKVRFEARGDPYRVGVCHCLTCRKVHGAPFNFYVVFPRDAVTVTGDVTVFASSEHGRRREPWLPEFPTVVRRYEGDRPEWKRTER